MDVIDDAAEMQRRRDEIRREQDEQDRKYEARRERERRDDARVHALHAAARLHQGRAGMDNPDLLKHADRMFEWLMREKPRDG